MAVNLLLFNLKTDADDDVLGFTTEWVNALARRCARVIVVTMVVGRIAVAENVAVYSVGREKGYSEAKRLLEFYRLVLRIVRNTRIDGCFIHMIPIFAVLAWPVLRIRKVPMVLWYAHKHVPVVLRIATALVDRVVASTPSGFRIRTPKVRFIGQGIDTTRFAPAPRVDRTSRQFVILTVGRVAPVKNLETVIEAFTTLPTRTCEGRLTVLRIIGSPLTARDLEYSARLRQLIRDREVEDRVEIRGGVSFSQVDGEYRDADLFVSASDTDSLDKTILEAMSAGLPVVTSNAAFQEIVDSSVSEWCVAVKRDVGSLASKLSAFTEMAPSRRGTIGSSLRAIVCRDHSIDALADRLMSQFRELGGDTGTTGERAPRP